MLHHLNLSHYSRFNASVWFSLAFQAGAINAGGFLACHRFVSHITGFATIFGHEVARASFHEAFGMLTVPLFFLLGSMFSAFFVDRKIAMGKAPHYNIILALISFIMFAVVLGGINGIFGDFGSPQADYALLILLCGASGMQNATITSASGAVVRTTHLTGITTDLGIGLVRVLFSGQSDNVKINELRANLFRAGLIAFFILGSTVSAFVFLKNQFLGFLIPASISLILCTGGLYLRATR